MRLLHITIGLLLAGALLSGWYIEARNIALLADVLGTSRTLGTKSLAEIGWNGTYLVIDGQIFGRENSHDQYAMDLRVDAAHRLVAAAHGQSIAIGSERGTLTMSGDPEPNPAFHAEPGDRITIISKQGLLTWPNWFETNYMTGNTPLWKRFTTYRVLWQKRSGASLALFWRYEQFYYPQDGWVAANAMGPDSCGLVDVRIVPERSNGAVSPRPRS